MNSKSKVYFFFDNVALSFGLRTKLKKSIESVFKNEKKQIDRLNYIFCSDNRLLQINRQFLNHDYYTDVITFDLSDKNTIIGEIYISVDRVKDNAKKNGVTITHEICRVIFHAALHLCGYDDKTKGEKDKMKKKEQYYLDRHFR